MVCPRGAWRCASNGVTPLPGPAAAAARTPSDTRRCAVPPRAPACLPNDELTNHTPLLCGHTGPRRATQATQATRATQATQGHTGHAGPHRATQGRHQRPHRPHGATEGHVGHTGHWSPMHGPPYLPLTSSRSLLSGLASCPTIGDYTSGIIHLGLSHNWGLYIWDYPIIGDYTSGIIHLGLSHVGRLSHLGSYRA